MVETDHQPLTSIWKRLLQLQAQDCRDYSLDQPNMMYTEYLQGRENVIDAPSSVAPLKLEPQDCNTSLNNTKTPVHHITQITPASPERL